MHRVRVTVNNGLLLYLATEILALVAQNSWWWLRLLSLLLRTNGQTT